MEVPNSCGLILSAVKPSSVGDSLSLVAATTAGTTSIFTGSSAGAGALMTKSIALELSPS